MKILATSTLIIGLLGASAAATAVMAPAEGSSRALRPLVASATPTSAAGGSSMEALAALDDLPVKGRAAKTGYARARFGAAWSDTDRNGCDTRNDVLRRDLTSTVLASSGCVVLSGRLSDPYSGADITFVRGLGTSGTVQIDHVVALGDAWVTGAQAQSLTARTRFANDPLNLLAVKGSLNDQKGDSDAASWLPPRRTFRCDYVARQVAVKRAYGLWVTAAEHAAMQRILTACPDEVLPARADVTFPSRVIASPTPSSTATSTTTPTASPIASVTISPSPTVAPTTTAGTDPRFRTCGEANVAGYGPYRRGVDPEYAWYRDADGDGLVCER